jgi:hypothetical protein
LQGKFVEASQLLDFGEVEAQMKQLHTVITRCSKRLNFVEPASSDSGKAFSRFLLSNEEGEKKGKLAVKQVVSEVKESIKTSNQWVTRGLNYAMFVDIPESAADAIRHTKSWLAHALKCFQQGKKKSLERALQVHHESIRLRTEEYPRWTREKIESDEEFEVMLARHLVTLAAEGLLREASEFFNFKFLLNNFTKMVWKSTFSPFSLC